ncbi:hypothetical protein NDU88_005895 [Pleurodeles waltl]|uniref:MHC class I antigen n=1 Tax=Pleurodeles waltl TaxID=8319 RepID=A0AAV7QIH1_PLEWA|nr:hypothetical protein NDU88_005895 [Pleurodeles waltl]
MYAWSLGCDVAYTYEEVLASLESYDASDQTVLSKRKWEEEMMNDKDLQMVRKYIIDGWRCERSLRYELRLKD